MLSPAIEIQGNRVWTVTLHASGHFDIPFQSRPFPCLVLAGDRTSVEIKKAVAKRLIDAGCRFVVCAGVDCMAWHDEADDYAIELETSGELPGDDVVLTTWHDGESVEKIALYFSQCTFEPTENQSYAEMQRADFLVLLVGSPDSKDQMIDRIAYYLDPANDPPDEDE
ncbi:MAG: hypothetical protein R2832_19730 [Rhodothermales bacterium]